MPSCCFADVGMRVGADYQAVIPDLDPGELLLLRAVVASARVREPPSRRVYKAERQDKNLNSRAPRLLPPHSHPIITHELHNQRVLVRVHQGLKVDTRCLCLDQSSGPRCASPGGCWGGDLRHISRAAQVFRRRPRRTCKSVHIPAQLQEGPLPGGSQTSKLPLDERDARAKKAEICQSER